MKTTNSVEAFLALIANVFDAWSVVLFQAEKEGMPASVAACHSADAHMNRTAIIPPGKGLVGWILRNRSPLLVDSIDESQTYLGYYQEGYIPDIRSFMGCPLPGGGALCVDSRNPQAFSGGKEKLLHQFALFLPRLQQLTHYTGYNREVVTYFTALEHISTLRAGYTGWQDFLDNLLPLLKEVANVQYVALATSLEGGQSYVLEGEYPPLVSESKQGDQPLSSGIAGWVLRNGEAVYNEGAASAGTSPVFGKLAKFPNFSSSACLPVVVQKQICGVLCLADMDARSFSPEIRSFLRMAVEDMGRLLENITLRHTLQKRMPKGSLQADGPVAYDPDSPNAMPKSKPE